MPPFLRRGQVIGRKSKSNSRKFHLCYCWDCCRSTTIINSSDGLPSVVNGRLLGPSEYKAHTAKSRRSGVGTYWDATLSQAHLDVELPLNETFPGVPPTLDPLDASDSHQGMPKEPQAPPESMDQLYTHLKSVQVRLESLSKSIQDPWGSGALVFTTPPTAESPTITTNPDNLYLTKLDPNAVANEEIIRFEDWLVRTRGYIHSHPMRRLTSKLRVLEAVVVALLDDAEARIRYVKEEQWESLRIAAVNHRRRKANLLDTTYVMDRPYLHFNPIILTAFLLAASLNILSHLSLKGVGDVLKGIQNIIDLSAGHSDATSEMEGMTKKVPSDAQTVFEMGKNIPSDARTVFNALPSLAPKYRSFASCPKCWALHGFDPANPSSIPITCTARSTYMGPTCGAHLRRETKGERVQACREFLYHDFKHWIAWMFCRPDIAEALEWDPFEECDERGDVMKDIWDGSVLRDFRGPDGDGRFVVKLPNERRLVFSFNYDSLNPYGNHVAGKAVKISGMYMACLNLPRPLRFLVENVYLVGIVPGPDAPSTSEINHYLRPLINDLIDLWHNGLFLTRTSTHPHGLLVRCALVPIVCDLPAARQIAGFAQANCDDQCHECKLQRLQMENLDYWTWPRRNNQEHRVLAREWLNKLTEKARDQHFEFGHVRWSELLRLPYWDPTKYVVIDSMHGFYLGMLQRHCRDIWGMSADVDDGEGITFDTTTEGPSTLQLDAARRILHEGNEKDLEACPVDVLRLLSREEGLRYAKKLIKRQLVQQLMDYRVAQRWFNSKGDPMDTNGVIRPRTDTTADVARQLYESGTKTFMRKELSLVQAEAILTMLGIHTAKESSLKSMTDMIQKARAENGIIDERERLLKGTKTPSRYSGRQSRVLGRETLSEVTQDMERTHLPTWVSRGPKHPGAAKQGRLKADEWKSFCLIHLPITLIRLWGSAGEDSRKRQVLNNFMDLVQAIRLSSLRNITTTQVTQYEQYIHRYLRKLLQLYPGTSIAPYQHLSLHFGEHLRRWGPTHSWRCFAFERFNGLMQSIQTNSKFGELERTIFTKFCEGQRLRALFTGSTLPPSVQDFVDRLSVQHRSNIRSTFMQDNLEFDEDRDSASWTNSPTKSISPHLFTLLQHCIQSEDPTLATGYIPNKVWLRKGVQRLGKSYQAKKSGDSYIIFDGQDGRSAGRIGMVFTHQRRTAAGTSDTETFIQVHTIKPLREEFYPRDPFRSLPCGGRLFHDDEGEEQLIPLSGIICHFAYTEMEIAGIPGRCIHVLPLDSYT